MSPTRLVPTHHEASEQNVTRVHAHTWADPPLPRWALVGLGAVMTVGWAAAIWVAAHVHADPTLRTAALFAHLASLVLGLGAVLVADLVGLLWLIGRRTVADVARTIDQGHPAIWAGLAGLVLSGVLLQPDLTSSLVRLKLVLVLVVGLNGLHAHHLRTRIHQLGSPRTQRALLFRSLLSGLISQGGWWGATLIGFVDTQ